MFSRCDAMQCVMRNTITCTKQTVCTIKSTCSARNLAIYLRRNSDSCFPVPRLVIPKLSICIETKCTDFRLTSSFFTFSLLRYFNPFSQYIKLFKIFSLHTNSIYTKLSELCGTEHQYRWSSFLF